MDNLENEIENKVNETLSDHKNLKNSDVLPSAEHQDEKNMEMHNNKENLSNQDNKKEKNKKEKKPKKIEQEINQEDKVQEQNNSLFQKQELQENISSTDNQENQEDNNIQEQENEVKKQEDEIPISTTKKKNHSVLKLCLIGASILILFLIIFSTIFALLNLNNDKIISGVFIKGVNVSNLSKEEAKTLVQDFITPKLTENILIKHDDYETTITPEQVDCNFDVDQAIELAYSIGRSGNLLQNNYSIVSTLFSNINIDAGFTYNSEALDKMITDIADKLPGKTIEPSYYIEENNLIITNGKDGITTDIPNLKEAVINSLHHLATNQTILIATYDKKADKIDLAKIYQEVKRDPVDAYYTSDPFVVHPHVDGIDFNISFEEAQKLLEEEKEEYTIPLKTIKPNKTTNQIGTEAFPDLLSEFSTNYYASNVNRTTNLKLATNKINGSVLMPGEEFSYNKVVGKRTIEAGFKDAAVFQNGKVVDGLGGGICQISSTLYDAVLLANLEIVERSNHGFVTSYLEAGKDATVVYGAIDFRFKNSRKYPIKIVGTVSGGVATFKIYGKKEETEYDVKITTKKLQSTPFKVSYIDDPSLAKGKTKVIQGGMYGCKVETYKSLYLNGELISTTLLSRDTYNAMTKIIARGTKE